MILPWKFTQHNKVYRTSIEIHMLKKHIMIHLIQLIQLHLLNKHIIDKPLVHETSLI